MEDAGLVDVWEKYYQWPVGPWQRGTSAGDRHLKKLGHWCQENIKMGLEGFSMALMTRYLNKSRFEVYEALLGVRNDISNSSLYTYLPM